MINGIKYLKEKYPGRNSKDYQPAGLDLRIGKVYALKNYYQDSIIGIIDGHKFLPELEEVELVTIRKEGKEYEVFRLDPDEPYIVEVQDPIKIGDNNAQVYKPRSSLLRSFVTVETALGDPGYDGHLQFLVINMGYDPFYISKGERFAQLIDYEVKDIDESYDGDYQHDKHKQ